MEKISNSPKQKNEVPTKLKLAFATGEISDMIAYQGFSYLVFTFYYAVVGLNVTWVSIVFLIWSVYAAIINMVWGEISDRTKTHRFGGGRRRPWITLMVLPLSVVMLLLFTPLQGNTTLTLVYFLVIICVFDTFYAAYSLNHTSLYPEMFLTDKAREEAGAARRILMIVGLLIAFVMPSLFIPQMTPNQTISSKIIIPQYELTGIAMGILIFCTLLVHIKWGIREPPYEQIQARKSYSIKDSLKSTLKNRKFIIFAVCSLMNWFVFGLFPFIMPVYTVIVLGQEATIMNSILLLVAFLSSIPGVLFWSKVDAKVGSRNGFMISMTWWGISFLPLFFITQYWMALVLMIFIGIGLGGSPYFIDRNISNIIDDDELKTNQRREGSYYGVHGLIIRMAIILQIVSIFIVLSAVGLWTFSISNVTPQIVHGLQILLSLFPAGALLIGLIFLKFFPLTKAVVDEIQLKHKENLKQSAEKTEDNSKLESESSENVSEF